jgi:AAA domain
MKRPYFYTDIAKLETLFRDGKTDTALLVDLDDELRHRKTDRAKRLRSQVTDALAYSGAVKEGSRLIQPGEFALEAPSATKAPLRAPPTPVSAAPFKSTAAAAPRHRPQPVSNTAIRPHPPSSLHSGQPTAATSPIAAERTRADTVIPPAGKRPPTEVRPEGSQPTDILKAWIALEVLSPQTYRRPEQLASGDRTSIAKLAPRLPWQVPGEKSRPGRQLYYQLVLGSIYQSTVVERLVAIYGDDRPERPRGSESAVIAAVTLRRDGSPLDEDAVSISSFAWALQHALAGDLEILGKWTDVEKGLNEQLQKLLVRKDEQGKTFPLTVDAIETAYEWLVAQLKLDRALVRPPEFAVRIYPSYKATEAPEPLLLNSFFLRDLTRAQSFFRNGTAPPALKRYLGEIAPSTRINLLQDDDALSEAVAPVRFPGGQWPAPGRHPLVLLQQAAVNLATSTLQEEGIVAVNGPPGTGKTTLLRDLVADLVTRRAEAIAKLERPEDSFQHSGHKLKVGNSWIHLYSVPASLKGFEMLVASSNNKAVENVSAELPAKRAIASDCDLRYFKTLADGLIDQESWGLIAAVLGNAQNRSRFRQNFWWDEEIGFRRYLASASGTPQFIQQTDPAGVVSQREPEIIAKEKPPREPRQALINWRGARKQFLAAKAKTDGILNELETVRKRCALLPELLAAGRAWRALADSRPGFWARLFRSASSRRWRELNEKASARLRSAVDGLDRVPSAITSELRTAARKPFASPELTRVLHEVDKLLSAAETRRKEIGSRFVDHAFFAQPHDVRHKTPPWLDAAAHAARDELFTAAMQLHRAFIDVAAKPIRHNLGALMSALAGSAAPKPIQVMLPNLWSTLFLVIPVISTTFASVDRMLGELPPESLGWLLIDEAGQAIPQAAVGALMRGRRAVVVGDPIQVAPVVTLPDTLTAAICRRFCVDPDRFNAPEASVQTLADSATGFFAQFETDQGSRDVGVPLLVHRRCDDPMFSIANDVAYANLMVQAKQPCTSLIRDTLGSSRWIDVESHEAQDKWSPTEGEVVRALLHRLREADTPPNLFIVTPFVAVQDGLRKLVEDDAELRYWLGDARSWSFDRIGTIHTVQGREAEAVIFVLGAPLLQQAGARRWAASRPNLLNVAVTRAQEALYVIGSHSQWSSLGMFARMGTHLPVQRSV